jgi:putative exporter of polyketide antibiotics
MHTRNIQTFLMVSAAFFAMSAPVRSNPGSAGALSNAVGRTTQVASASVAVDRVARSTKEDEGSQNS